MACASGSSIAKSVLLPSFQELAEKRQFGTIQKILDKAVGDQAEVWLFEGSVRDHPLFVLVQQRPTATVVKHVLQVCELDEFGDEKRLKFITNGLGQTLLHVAILHGCDPDVIDLFVSAAACADERQRRLPLHFAAGFYHDHPGSNSKISWMKKAACVLPSPTSSFGFPSTGARNTTSYPETIERKQLQIVASVLKSYPQAILSRDVHGFTSLDLAIRRDAPRRIIQYLRHAEHRIIHKEGGHDDSVCTMTHHSIYSRRSHNSVPEEISLTPRIYEMGEC